MDNELTKLPLHHIEGHIFLELGGDLWLIDTGSPFSFGTSPKIEIANRSFSIPESFQGLDADILSSLVNVSCAGLIGLDILISFDLIFDVANNELLISNNDLVYDGIGLKLNDFMGFPIIMTVQIGGNPYPAIFDTGAQMSYFQNDIINDFPYEGIFDDFHIVHGQFKARIHKVLINIAGTDLQIPCGILPELHGKMIIPPSVQGIIGSDILKNHKVAYLPRRNILAFYR